jgi:hypothetical protein
MFINNLKKNNRKIKRIPDKVIKNMKGISFLLILSGNQTIKISLKMLIKLKFKNYKIYHKIKFNNFVLVFLQ